LPSAAKARLAFKINPEREESASQSSIYFFCRPTLTQQSAFFAPYFCVDVCACPFPARSFHLRPLLLFSMQLARSDAFMILGSEKQNSRAQEM
jgi:hypothetical protein